MASCRVETDRCLDWKRPSGGGGKIDVRRSGGGAFRARLDAIRMATDNATTALGRAVAPHYRRAEDEGRMVLLEARARTG